MDELINVALKEGPGYGMFACLLIYALKTTGERETRYQGLLDKLAEKFNLVKHIQEDVKEIKSKINEKRQKDMNIDLKAREKNKAFQVYVISAMVLLSQQLGLKIFPENWDDILNTVLGVLTMLGIIVDNSTSSLNDSTSSKEEGVE